MKKNIIGLMLILTVSMSMVSAQQDTKFQAIFLYNFTRQLGWPDTYKTGDIVIKVLGESEVVDELNAFAKNNPVNGQNVVSQATSASNIGKCHIIFIPQAKSNELNTVITSLEGSSTLIVTEQSNLTTKGAGISFIQIKEGDGSSILKYQFNTENISKYKIKVSSNFMTLGLSQ